MRREDCETNSLDQEKSSPHTHPMRNHSHNNNHNPAEHQNHPSRPNRPTPRTGRAASVTWYICSAAIDDTARAAHMAIVIMDFFLVHSTRFIICSPL